MEDKIIELADYLISENTTYREAKIACEKLLKQVSHEIELRALESETVRNETKKISVQNNKTPSVNEKGQECNRTFTTYQAGFSES